MDEIEEFLFVFVFRMIFFDLFNHTCARTTRLEWMNQSLNRLLLWAGSLYCLLSVTFYTDKNLHNKNNQHQYKNCTSIDRDFLICTTAAEWATITTTAITNYKFLGVSVGVLTKRFDDDDNNVSLYIAVHISTTLFGNLFIRI